MILPKYDYLPEFLKTKEAREYYRILENKKSVLIYKKMFDLIFSAFLIIVCFPLMAFTAILIKLDSKGPIFFRQKRVTQFGEVFFILKFRTMHETKEKSDAYLTLKDDPRITRIGKILRKFRIDELPQLFNILCGDMTFVGTRPEVKKYVRKYNPEMLATLLLPAGVTSRACIEFKNEDQLLEDKENSMDIYIEKILPQKMKEQLNYIKNLSFQCDIKIIFETLLKIFL
ncbi:MAG: sugar transferase [Oscillospiraceae bacterium]|nr:sugar transferase [Oscillospiraceae bacterium]